jgi:hypothetical protein
MVKIKSGDTSMAFTSTLLVDGIAVNLTGCSVLFLLKSFQGSETSFAATVVSAVAGTVKYTVGNGFPAVAGKYRQEWQVTFSDSSALTFPNGAYNEVEILADLN